MGEIVDVETAPSLRCEALVAKASIIICYRFNGPASPQSGNIYKAIKLLPGAKGS
jgi:hypothetical protein